MADIKKLHPPVVEEPPLTEYDRIVIGKGRGRLLIPVDDFNHLLQYCDLIAGWVEETRFQCRRTDGPPYDSPRYPAYRRQQLGIIRRELHAVSERIRRIHKGLKDEDA